MGGGWAGGGVDEGVGGGLGIGGELSTSESNSIESIEIHIGK